MTNTNIQQADNNTVQAKPLDLIDQTLQRIEEMQRLGKLMLPSNYSIENALRSAWLIIQQTVDLNKKPALEVCTGISIANTLFDMVLKGLNPVKKQCYFIVYGNKLTLQQSYFGTVAIGKRVAGVEDAVGIPIYQGDKFKYSIDIKTGIKTVTEHEQEFDNIDVTKVRGAYAVITYLDGHVEYEIMTMQQIRASWEMGTTKGNSPAHQKFPDQMAAKTVVSRALKIPINTSNDDDLFVPEEPNIRNKQVEENVKKEIAQHGNKDEIGFDDDPQQAEVVPLQLNDPQTDILTDVKNIGAQLDMVESKLAHQPLEVKEEIQKQTTQVKAPFA